MDKEEVLKSNMKEVILDNWKSKLGYLFNHKDLEELENIINYYEEENEKLKETLNLMGLNPNVILFLEEENKELQEKCNIRSKAYNNILLENTDLHNKIDKAIEELDRVITFCENDSQGGYNICNMAIRNYKNIRSLLKDSDVE